jgi:hypothetical protein
MPAGLPSAQDNILVSVSNPSNAHFAWISLLDDAGTQKVTAAVNDAGGVRYRKRTQTLSTGGTWYAITGVFTDSSTSEIYVDGAAGSAYSGPASVTPASLTDCVVGVWVFDPTPLTAGFFNGTIAEVAIWDAALSVGEVTSLVARDSPLQIRPAALRGYYQLVGKTSPEIEFINGKSLALTGSPTTAAHPRVFYPRRKFVIDSSTPPLIQLTMGRCIYLTA